MIDASGIHGYILHYSFAFAMVASAFLVFVYCWRKGHVVMDEEPKMQVFEDE